MTKREKAGMIRRLEKERKMLGKRRDALRDIVDEYEGLLGSCDRAEQDLQRVIDTLSEYA